MQYSSFTIWLIYRFRFSQNPVRKFFIFLSHQNTRWSTWKSEKPGLLLLEVFRNKMGYQVEPEWDYPNRKQKENQKSQEGWAIKGLESDRRLWCQQWNSLSSLLLPMILQSIFSILNPANTKHLIKVLRIEKMDWRIIGNAEEGNPFTFPNYKERENLGEKTKVFSKASWKKGLWISAPLHYTCSLENEVDR